MFPVGSPPAHWRGATPRRPAIRVGALDERPEVQGQDQLGPVLGVESGDGRFAARAAGAVVQGDPPVAAAGEQDHGRGQAPLVDEVGVSSMVGPGSA